MVGGIGQILADPTQGTGTGAGASWTPVTPIHSRVEWVTAVFTLGAGTGTGDCCTSPALTQVTGKTVGTC